MTKTILTKEDIIKILKNYYIGKFVSFQQFDKGHVQTNVLIITSKRKFVLRYYETRTKNYILGELEILNFLHKHKYPCAMPILNSKNEFLGKYKRKYFALFKFIEGKHIEKFNPKQHEEMIRYLALLHTIGCGHDFTHSIYRESHDQKYALKTAKK